jgi:CBS domain-containing protein
VFFGENVDIHHIFPQDWCKKRGHQACRTYDSIINKTPLSFRTNRIIGGVAPSEYLARLEKHSPSTKRGAKMSIDLEKISSQLEKGVVPAPVTVRQLLEWLGVSRRGNNVVRQIRRKLEQHQLETHPDFEVTWIDSHVRFVRAGTTEEGSDRVIGYRIDALDAANQPPVSVAPDALLNEAVSLMLAHEYSQLPVLTSERMVKGTISWRSIGSRMSLGRECSRVRDCMDPPIVVSSDISLFEAIDRIAAKDYVLVKANDGRITGIVTSTDLAGQFRNLAEPFLLIGEIESLLRSLLHGKFSSSHLTEARDSADSGRVVEGVSDLTLGELLRLLGKEERWLKLNLNVDRSDFVKRLDRVRAVRNDIMHFDPEGLEPGALDELRSFSKYLGELRRLG